MNQITAYLTSTILDSMNGQTVLKENDLEIPKCLQNIYAATIQTESLEPAPLKTPEPNSAKPETPTPIVICAVFLDAVLPALKAKSCLSAHKT